MHTIEPYYNWQDHYIASEDPFSPFYQREYNEFAYTQKIYNYYIHPQWDNIGSPTLFLKILFADYNEGFVIMEMIGEWNDTLHNDVMTLKREIVDHLMLQGISKFILIGENVLNFHPSDDCYYEEWFEEVEDQDGWIAMLNFREHVMQEFEATNVDSYFMSGGRLQEMAWRTLTPRHLHAVVGDMVQKRLGI